MKNILEILKEVALAMIGSVVIGAVVGVMEYTTGKNQDHTSVILILFWSVLIALRITLILNNDVNN